MKTEMTNERRREIEIRAIHQYGISSQQEMCIEEMAELTKALCKLRRHIENAPEFYKTHENVVEEIADVQIMLDQMRMIFGSTADMEDYKLNRLWARMEASNA